MLYIFLSACCSVGVSVLLKLFRRYNIDIFQAITWNYAMAVVLTLLFLKPQLAAIHEAPVYIYTSLGLLLPDLFVILGLSVKHTGIVRTDIAQRLSLIIPLLISFFLFKEMLTVDKTAGITIGLAAVLCLIPWQQGKGKLKHRYAWVYLLVVFAGMGIIDVLFKQMALFKGASYTTSLLIVYVLAFILCLVRLLYLLWVKHVRFALHYIIGGVLLGMVNFGNILFYLKAHQALASKPSIVFSSMNMGVIALGTLVGTLLFNEKLSRLNKIGIGLSILAIAIIYLSLISKYLLPLF